MIEELWKSGHYRAIGQAFVNSLPVKSVVVSFDGRTCSGWHIVRNDRPTDGRLCICPAVTGSMSDSHYWRNCGGIDRCCVACGSEASTVVGSRRANSRSDKSGLYQWPLFSVTG
jgi:hypothetical protein